MSKRNIIIAVIAIIALGIGTLAVMNLETSDKEETLPEAGKTYTVYSEEASKLQEVKVTTADGEIRAVNTGKSEWTIDDLPAGEVDPSKAYSLAGTVSTIISKNKFDADDLAKYGLDKPQITVTITKKSGESDILYVGDLSPTLGEYFIMLDGDDSVYTMYSYKVDALQKPVSFYTEFDRFEVTVDDITDVKVTRDDGGYEIKLVDKIDENTNNVWEMVSPYKSGANDDYIDNKILAPIEDISLSNPVEGADAYFDGSSPVITLTIKPYDNATGKYGTEYTETLTVGRAEGNTAYVKYKDEVYTTPASSVAFAGDSAFNIVSKLQALVDISLVKSVTVEYGGASHTIGVTKGSGNKYGFSLDGKATDAKISQEIYRNIIGIAVDGVYDGQSEGETMLKLTFSGIKSSDDTTIEIKELDNLSCVLERDGEALFTVRTSKIDEFKTLFDAYVKANTEG